LAALHTARSMIGLSGMKLILKDVSAETQLIRSKTKITLL